MLVAKLHQAETALNPLLPKPHVNTTIGPAHCSVATALVIFIIARICVSTQPLKQAHTVLQVFFVLPFISIAFLITSSASPFAISVLQSVSEFTYVDATVSPLVLSKSVGKTFLVLANILVSVGKKVTAITVSQVFFPLALEFVFVLPNMDSIALSFTIDPLSYI